MSENTAPPIVGEALVALALLAMLAAMFGAAIALQAGDKATPNALSNSARAIGVR